MSIRLIDRVFKNSKHGGTKLLCLLAIADFANDAGIAFPAVHTLAEKIRMSKRNTNYLLKELEQSGELEIERNAGPRGCNIFRVKTLQGAGFASVKAVARDDATDGSNRMQPIAPEPSLNHQEPSVVSTSAKQAAEVLTYLNEKTGRNYKPVKANIGLIQSRLAEGESVDSCKAIIDSKVASWSADKKMSEYLRPATLFNATKFAQYVGELGGQNSSLPVWER